jgi:hypothetical protein
MPSPRPPLIVTASEAAALLPLPEQAAGAPLALPEAPARSVAPVADAPSDGVMLGLAEDDWSSRELRIEPEALLQHVHVLGPTGRGKTTALCNLYLEAARLDLGGAYIEPKGDAIGEILKRIPAKRTDDVVLLDFGDELHPPALNLLACAPGDEDLHAHALVAIFARLFGRFWGPRSEDILRSALATLLANRDPQLPMPTLADVFSLLTDPAEKARRPVSDPVALAHFFGDSGGPRRTANASRRSHPWPTSCGRSSDGGRCATFSARRGRPTSSGSSPRGSCCSSRCPSGRSATPPISSAR